MRRGKQSRYEVTFVVGLSTVSDNQCLPGPVSHLGPTTKVIKMYLDTLPKVSARVFYNDTDEITIQIFTVVEDDSGISLDVQLISIPHGMTAEIGRALIKSGEE